jgi:hypothetical protein
MTASMRKHQGRGPPVLRIHAGVSRHRASTRGLIAAPWTPASRLPCSREETLARRSRPWRHVLGLLLALRHDYS